MVPDRMALALARDLPLRADMAAQFEAEGAALPAGPKWALAVDGRVIGLGGLEPKGAGASLGWLLVADGLRPRDWVVGRWAMQTVMEWAATRSIRRVRALIEPANAGAAPLLARLGFQPWDAEGDCIVMTRELV